MHKNITALYMKSYWWIVTSFLVNLVALSPLYWLFPIFSDLIRDFLDIETTSRAILDPMIEVFPSTCNFAWFLYQAFNFIFVIFWVLICMLLSYIFIWFVKDYITYIFRAGNISVVSALIKGKSVPNQLSFGTKNIVRRFGSVNLMFVGDKLTRKAVLEINGYLFRDTSKLPDVLKKKGLLGNMLRGVIRTTMEHLDEVVLSYVILNEGQVWSLYCEAIVKYIQAWKEILVEAVKIVLSLYVINALINLGVYLLCFASLRDKGLVSLVIGLALCRWILYCIKITFIESYEYTRILASYYSKIDKMETDASLFEKLSRVSDAFKSMWRKSGRESVIATFSSSISESFSIEGNEFEQLTQLAENPLFPKKLSSFGLFERIEIIKDKISKKRR